MPLLLDLFAGAGGAAMGYHRAGFTVIGVDIKPQPRYPFQFIRADALTFPLDGYDVIHASPPCQAFTLAWNVRQNEHPNLIPQIRERLQATGKPYIIENVRGAPLIDPITLCGNSFGLQVYRHRLFESNLALREPEHIEHTAPLAVMGRAPKEGEFIHVTGHFIGRDYARKAMGIEWMTRNELSESIPPAYTEWLGRQIQRYLIINATPRG